MTYIELVFQERPKMEARLNVLLFGEHYNTIRRILTKADCVFIVTVKLQNSVHGRLIFGNQFFVVCKFGPAVNQNTVMLINCVCHWACPSS